MMVEANLALKIPRWDVRGKRHLEVAEKYYATDTVQPDDFAGIRHIRVPNFLLSDPRRPAGA